MQNKLRKLINKCLFFIPTSLPVGMTEFYLWADSIINTYDLPDNDSIRFALATTVLHLNSTSNKKAKRYFGKHMRKSMSNEVAAGVMQELKQKQLEKIKEEQEAAQKAKNEAIVIVSEPSSGAV